MGVSLMNGQWLFLLYAFPCVEARMFMGAISQRRKEQLERYIQTSTTPSRKLLKHCFPNAFRSLRDYALERGENTWDLKSVQGYWRSNHGHSEDCAVIIVTVNRTESSNKLIWDPDGRVYINVYSLDLTVDDHVFTHRRCVIEIVKDAASS